jgi:sigma-B regulation protein RsbU (phosphoserine phosphatase)
MGDVRGRGPQAAALTSMARYTIRTAAQLGRTPADVLRVLNDAIYDEAEEERFCSAIFATLTIAPSSGEATVTYANAGHPPFAVVRRGGVQLLPPTGRLVGILPEGIYGQEVVRLERGDVLVLYTDGVSEARRDQKEFGDERLVDVLVSLRDRTAQELADGLTAEAQAYAGAGVTDDAAVFVVAIT